MPGRCVLSDVASYGLDGRRARLAHIDIDKAELAAGHERRERIDRLQLGRVGDALLVLLAHIHPKDEKEEKVIAALHEMLEQIAKVKERHKRPALHPPERPSSAR